MSGPDDDHETEERLESGDSGVRDRIEQLVDRARSGFDEGIVDVLSVLLDTETRTRVYVSLRQHPWSTVEEVSERTGLHPATVRDTLDALVDEGGAERRERDGDGTEAEYTAVPPSELVGGAIDPVRDTVGSVVRDEEGEESVRIEVDSGSSAEATVGETDADVETDLEGEAELDEEGARVEGEAGGEVDVETADGEAEVGGSVDAEVGTDGVDVDVDATVETPDGDESGGSDGSGSAGADEGGDESAGSDSDGSDETDSEEPSEA